MSIEINAEGVDRAIAQMRGALDALGGKRGERAIANALNQSLAQGRKEAARQARRAYTAPIKKLFDNINIQRARASKLEGQLELSGKPGVSLIHFKAQPNTPATHPKSGVTVQVKRKESRSPAVSKHGGSKSFIGKKKQGGYGVFVRHLAFDKDGNRKDKFEMLLGPSPIQALQRRDAQAHVAEKVREAFMPRLNEQIDRALPALAGK